MSVISSGSATKACVIFLLWLNEVSLVQLIMLNDSQRTNISLLSEIFCSHALLLK